MDRDITKGELERLVHDYFKPRTGYERIWCKSIIMPFAEKLIKVIKNKQHG